MSKISGASLFACAGIGEFYLKKLGIDIKVANEMVSKRCELYRFFHPKSNMICGDITKKEVFDRVNNEIKKNNCKFLIATPPCQGMSSLGKKSYETDERNYLFRYVIDIIKDNDFEYILFENVAKFLKVMLPYNGNAMKIEEILKFELGDRYVIEPIELNAMNYGIPQSRPRSFIKIYKSVYKWNNPVEDKKITLREAIGHLPSLESGECSDLKWHNAKIHNEREVLAARYTKEGCSAIANDVYYPKKENGDRIKGFHNTYKRMKWDEPAPTRAMNNGNMGGTNNIHPGKLKADGTFSDARALTLRELFIVSSLPEEMDLPEWCSDSLIRTVIGEAIPPKFTQKVLEGIKIEDD